MKDIKIFVSHRIDIESELFSNPLYHHTRCGAVFDNLNPMNIPGDDTGDNISGKRLSFCEFTVQYWAWKNIEADYYGLCHYRRFLSFSDKRFKANEMNVVYRPLLLKFHAKKFALSCPETMSRTIEKFDIVTSESADVRTIFTPDGHKDTVLEHWLAYDGVFFEKRAVNLLFELIDEFYPQYSKSAAEYFDGKHHRGYNCYVMKKELFFRMCRLQFDIMEEVEKRLDTAGYTATMLRTPAFLGEMLYGIFVYHVTRCESVRIKELQLVFFNNTDKSSSTRKYFVKCASHWLLHGLRMVSLPLFPLKSKRREVLKKMVLGLVPIKNRGVADPPG